MQDTDGELLTRLALELEQGPFLGRRSVAEAVQASVVGLGVDVQTFADEDEFGASDTSLMGEADDVGEPMPQRYAELGITGPLRFGAQSFIHGLFEGTEPTAHAWLAGTVQRSERRRVELTEQSFVVARVRSTGFEADICLSDTGEDPLPGPGHVIAGTVFLVGSIEDLADPLASGEDVEPRGLGRLLGRR